MTNQEIFDKVKTHLLAQNAKALDVYGECVYFAEDGKRCAAGCIIPEELYRQDYEGLGACSREFQDLWDDLDIDEKGVDLIHVLQNVHDNFEPEEWPARLSKIAQERGLQ